MSAYDPYESRERSSRYAREERRGDPRYSETFDNHLKVYSPTRELVPRAREDSDLSVEEIRRDFPPPGHSREIRRARSAEPGIYDEYEYQRSRGGYDPRDRDYDRYDRDYDRDHDRESDRRRSKKGTSSVYHEEEEKSRHRVLSKQEKIIAAVAGAALAMGGKEVYDRREAKDDDVQRNYLASAALGAAGALAGYQGAGFYNKHATKDEKKSHYVVHRGRDGKITEYISDEEGDSKEKKGNKSFLESALAASGLGVAVKALTGGGKDDDKSDKRSRKGSPDSKGSRSKSRGPGESSGTNKIQKAAMASLIAGATEAFRVAKEPGGWKGEKAKRVLTAAAGAATIDAAHDSEKSSKLGLAESVIGGLVGNRVINGSKSNIEADPKRPGRSRSRSRAKSDGGGGGTGLAALATAGLGAFGAKKLVDHHREKSRERSRSRRRSADSYDSRDGSPDRRRRSRSRSVVDSARRSLAKIGIGNDPDARDRDRDRDRDRRRDQDDYDDYDDRGSSRHHHRRHSDDKYNDDYSSSKRGGRDDYDDERSYKSSRQRSRSRRRGKDAGSDTDLGDSSEDEKRAKKMKGKQILKTGFATVATIHAAHEVYQSMEKRHARQKAVKEGRLSPEEAKKLKTKSMLQDAASVGIAALGIKGAISELKEAKEISAECKEFKHEKEIRHKRRLERVNQQKRLTNSERRYEDDEDDYHSPAPSQSDRYEYRPQYLDGNPYAALPAPPVGYDGRR
jgi:hypothetical protein